MLLSFKIRADRACEDTNTIVTIHSRVLKPYFKYLLTISHSDLLGIDWILIDGLCDNRHHGVI